MHTKVIHRHFTCFHISVLWDYFDYSINRIFWQHEKTLMIRRVWHLLLQILYKAQVFSSEEEYNSEDLKE